MRYEWNARKARRGYLLRMLGILLVVIIITSVPAWFVIQAVQG